MNAIGMASGAVMLWLGSFLIREPLFLPKQSASWLALGWLVLLGSVGLFQLFLLVVNRWSASVATFAISAMPVIAAGLGSLVLDQPITIELILGGLLVIAAVYIGAIRGAGQNSGETKASGVMSPEKRVAGEVAEPQS
jgi:drug/metabolite transporter (DMT)-like permease